MQTLRFVFFSVLMIALYQPQATGQSRIDSLRAILETKNIEDSTFLNTTIQLCKELQSTDSVFLIPEYAIRGLNRDTLHENVKAKFALHEILGNYYWQTGKLTEAADQFNYMRLIGETHLDNQITANSYKGLGTIYYQVSDYPKALQYYHKGLSLAGTDSSLLARFHNNLANTYLMMDQMDSVLHFYDLAITYQLRHGNQVQASITYGNIALAHLKDHNTHEVHRYMDLALESALKSGDSYQIASVYQLMGDITYPMHPSLASENYQTSLVIARRIKSYSQIRKNLEMLSFIEEEKGNYKQALAFLNEVYFLDDSINLEQKRSRIARLEYDHQASVKMAAESERKHKQQLADERSRQKQRTLLVILSIAFVTLLILTILIRQVYRMQMKISKTKEQFFSMIAHDIRNPFSGILGLSGLLNEDADQSEDLTYRKRVNSLHKSLNQVYELLENLLQWSQAETGKIAFNPQNQLLSPFVHEVICLHTASGKQKGIRMENQIQKDLTARFDANMLQTIIRNLLSNALKFSPENSTVFISAEVRGTSVCVKVRDEGIGMDSKKIDTLFRSNKEMSTPGTNKETGTGLGLVLARSFVNRHGGKIWAESTPGQGTTIFFTLPD